MKKEVKVFKNEKEYNSALEIAYNFHKIVYNTILKYLQENGDIEIPEDWQDEYRYEYLEYDGTFTTTAIRLSKDGDDFYLEAESDEDGGTYHFWWDDVNNDMIIEEHLMGIIYHGFDEE